MGVDQAAPEVVRRAGSIASHITKSAEKEFLKRPREIQPRLAAAVEAMMENIAYVQMPRDGLTRCVG